MTNEYLERSRRLNEVILANDSLCRDIFAFFQARVNESTYPADSYFLGSGEYHTIFGIGSIRDPLNNQEVYLALRVTKSVLKYFFGDVEAIEDELKELSDYEVAFRAGISVPYFASLIFAGVFTDAKNVGIITEDLSCHKRYTLDPIGEGEYVTRIKDDKTETFFLDPRFCRGLPVRLNLDDLFKEDLRIDLPYSRFHR